MFISIHALREEGDDRAIVRDHECRGFLSTPSARRATWLCMAFSMSLIISIHALREEGDARATGLDDSAIDFYPRPPRGGRRGAQAQRAGPRDFYPRPPRGGRPLLLEYLTICTEISIHALREEGDERANLDALTLHDFYPRPPRGGRPIPASVEFHRALFLSTPSARRATPRHLAVPPGVQISIHALREEGDETRAAYNALPWKFLSTPSARRATYDVRNPLKLRQISIHALREEGDLP